MQLLKTAWRAWPETEALLAAFVRAGVEIRFVGGCVRDALLGIEASEVDLATPATPQEVMRILEVAGIRAIPTGLAHGTITARIGQRNFEITTLRRDVACDGRHAEVAFTTRWEEDANRRDFTINALFADAEGTVYDYTGGLADLALLRLRFIGNARARIQEDGLRMLRFFRFHAQLGIQEIDAEALAACSAEAARITQLSGERIAQEMLKLLNVPALSLSHLEAMQKSGVLGALGLPAPALSLLQAGDVWNKLALWVPEGSCAALIERWKLSTAQGKRIQAIAERAKQLHAALDIKTQKKYLRADGADIFQRAVQVAAARDDALAAYAPMISLADNWQPPVFPVTGADLLAVGFTAGPALGEALTALEAHWEAADYVPDKQSLLDSMKTV